MKNRGSTPILTNLVEVHPRNIHTKSEANPCSGLREEVEKLKKLSEPNKSLCSSLKDLNKPEPKSPGDSKTNMDD